MEEKMKNKKIRNISVFDYRQGIREMIEKISDERFLRCIYISLRDYLREKAE